MFGWFKRSQEPKAPFVERLETVERRLRALDTDWLEFEEKVQRKLWRAAKMKGAEESLPEAREGSQEPDQELPPELRGRDPVSLKILQLRRARFVRGG